MWRSVEMHGMEVNVRHGLVVLVIWYVAMCHYVCCMHRVTWTAAALICYIYSDEVVMSCHIITLV
jgi:hypothetical protein